jgi:hypothetical protein
VVLAGFVIGIDLLDVASAFKELHQHGSEDLRGDIMRLTFQGPTLRVGQGMCYLCWLHWTAVQKMGHLRAIILALL